MEDGGRAPTPERLLTPEEHAYGPRHGARRRLGAFATIAALALFVTLLTHDDRATVQTADAPGKTTLAVGRASSTTLLGVSRATGSGASPDPAASTDTAANATSTTTTPTGAASSGPPGAPAPDPGTPAPDPGSSPPPVDDGGPSGLTISVTPTHPAAGVPARLVFDSGGDASAFGYDLADGTSQGMGTPVCGAPFGGPKDVDHIWDAAGSYTVTLTVSGARCRADGSQAQFHAVTKTLTIVVAGGQATGSNGTAAPKLAVQSPSKAGTDVSITTAGTDADGFAYAVVVDWGDDSPRDIQLQALSGCQRGPGGTPSNGSVSFPFAHHFAQGGQYHVTITFFSTGCDGQSAQTDQRAVLLKL
jgi:hypothetical protein